MLEGQNPLIPVIPENITVHLGSPVSSAKNVTVSFSDYIKNVASSEIYPTWPDEAIRANVLAQISFALNRVYTEYYRSRGYDFDITTDTRFDQAFVNGRDIFENISFIVDELLGSYIRREGSIEPLFAQYCNGTTTTCAGLSQWGTVGLAEEGRSAFEILQYYFGDNIELVENAPLSELEPSLPPFPLRLGFASNDVAFLQSRLNRISTNYPSIPKIAVVNGVYDLSTRNAVIEFQRVFSLEPDGITGRATWYEVLRVYNAVKRLNELASEQLTFEELPLVFPLDLREGATGDNVRIVQYFLEYVSLYDDSVPDIAADGIYGPATVEAVQAFQRSNGLPVTGIIDEDTFIRLFDTYQGIIASLPEDMFEKVSEPFPGVTLVRGSEGESVRLLQQYINALTTAYPTIGTLTEDGIFGTATEKAVREFQRIFGQRQTGFVNAVTWDLIAEQYDNIAAGSYRADGQWSA